MNVFASTACAPVRVRLAPAAALPALLAHDLTPGTWEVIGLTTGVLSEETNWDSARPDRVCVLAPHLTALGWGALAPVIEEALTHPRLLTLLIPKVAPPPVSGRGGEPVLSFIGPTVLLPSTDAPVEQLCFAVLEPIMSGAPPGVGVVARECPSDDAPRWEPEGAPALPAAVVMAHRGLNAHLRAALASLALARPRPIAVRIGLDGDAHDDARPLAAEYPDLEFYSEPGSGRVGPYSIRQALVAISPEPAVVFHDSDDVSTADRFHWLLADLARGAGMVGSYELRYDPEDRELRASRFPLDVNAALRIEPKHPLLHPTSAVVLDEFRRAGGFSTDCVFGNDTQFLLRAAFHMSIRNVPRFLYIRREHPNALTTHPETGMDNPLRRARNQRWRSEFVEVLTGRLALAGSSLAHATGTNWRPMRVATPTEDRP